MKVTKEKLREIGASDELYKYWSEMNEPDLATFMAKANEYEHFDSAIWLFTRVVETEDNVKLAIYCAEQVLPIFEKEYPEDDRPRKAIQAAKDFQQGTISKVELASASSAAAAAASSADEASWAASDEASWAASAAAAWAAWAAWAAAAARAAASWAAARSASSSSWASARAASAIFDSSAAAEDKKEMQGKIIKYASSIIEGAIQGGPHPG